MVENFVKILLWVTLGASAIGCDEDEASVLADSLEVRLVTLDENGEERTVFKEGANVVFALKLINNSKQDIQWSNFCQLLQLDVFYLIYKWREDDEGKQELKLVGKPYPTPVNCPDINLPSKIPAGMNDYSVKIPWDNNQDNLPLTPGKYFTSLQYTFETESGSKEIDLKAEFEVQ
jgi:hypothetical protein